MGMVFLCSKSWSKTFNTWRLAKVVCIVRHSHMWKSMGMVFLCSKSWSKTFNTWRLAKVVCVVRHSHMWKINGHGIPVLKKVDPKPGELYLFPPLYLFNVLMKQFRFGEIGHLIRLKRRLGRNICISGYSAPKSMYLFSHWTIFSLFMSVFIKWKHMCHHVILKHEMKWSIIGKIKQWTLKITKVTKRLQKRLHHETISKELLTVVLRACT